MANTPTLKGASVLALASKPAQPADDRTPSLEGIMFREGDEIVIRIPASATAAYLNATAKSKPFVKVNASGDYSLDVPVQDGDEERTIQLHGNRVSLNLFMSFTKPSQKD